MKKIVIIPEHIYEKWDGQKFSGNDREGIRMAFDAFQRYYGQQNNFICEYYFRNSLLNSNEIFKASCNSSGDIGVVNTGCSDMASVISALSKKDAQNSWFFVDIWSDESKSFGNSIVLADIIAKTTKNFIFFNRVGGDELYMSEFYDGRKSFVDEIETKYKGLPAEYYYKGDYFSMLKKTKEYYLDSSIIKFGDNICRTKIKGNTMKDKKQNYEHIEAIPGPALSISKNDWDKMQEKFDVQKTEKELKKYESLFKKIHNSTNVRIDEKDRTL